MDAITNPVNLPLPSTVASEGSTEMKSLAEVKQVGEDFESVFLSMMLKEMRNSLEEGFFSGEGSDSFGGMFDLFIGKHLAKSSPIGVADMLVQQYSKSGTDAHETENADASTRVSFSA